MFADLAMAAAAYPRDQVFRVRGVRVLGRQMWRVDLDDFPGRVFGGPQVKLLAHRFCNRSAGASLGNQLRAAARPSAYNRW